MSFKIGFDGGTDKKTVEITAQNAVENEPVQGKKSLVKVYFDERNSAYSYYNDAFDLHIGDTVWVDGKLEGIRGRVIEINYNFKIRLSDYKRVIGVADTALAGTFNFVGPYFVTDGTSSLFDKVKTWFLPPEPEAEGDDIIVSHDDSHFNISNLSQMNISSYEAEKGGDYFSDTRVAFIEISNGVGSAIVEGHKPYIIEFCYDDGEISRLTCNCYTTGNCRHAFAAMLTLKEIISHIEKHYPEINIGKNGFSAVRKVNFLQFVIDSKNTGALTVD